MSEFIKYLALSAEYSEKGYYKKAIACWEKIIELIPNQSTPWVLMGQEYKKLNQWEKAIECYNKALQLNPDDEDAQFYKKKLQRKTQPNKRSFTSDDWDEMAELENWSIISPRNLKAFSLKKCELCGIEIDLKNQAYEDHLRSCIYNIGFYLGNVDLFHRTIMLIKKHIGNDITVSYLNSFSPGFLKDFYWPHFEKEGPTYFPIDEITDIIIAGLPQQKKDKLFYDDVILLLRRFFNILRDLVSYGDINPTTSFYATSILDLFNKIYEKNYDKYILSLNSSLDNLVSGNKKKIAHFWFRFRDLETRLLFYEENLLFKELLDDMLDDPNEIKVIKILNDAVPKYLNIDTYEYVNVITKNRKIDSLYLVALDLERIPE